MQENEIRAATTAERRQVADWLTTLDEPALATPSLCSRWTVKDVGAHLAVASSTSIVAFLVLAVRQRGNFHRTNALLAQQMAERPVTEIAGLLRSNAARRLSNPAAGTRAPLTDVLVHTGDMRRPLGLPHDPPSTLTRVALDFLTGGKTVGFVRRGFLDDVRLVADDLDASWGTGADVNGRGADLMMAACGRRAVLDQLAGPGVDVLRSRLG